jgi:uncharacterized protein
MSDPGDRTYPDRTLGGIYRRSRSIAVVGASHVPTEPAYFVPEYLQLAGYDILPVHPLGGEILGQPVYRCLADICGPVDIVAVFPGATIGASLALDAVAVGATTLWCQPDVDARLAVRLAVGAGLTVVTGRCIGATHAQLGLGPVPRRPRLPPRPYCDGYRLYRRRATGAAG